MFAHTKKPIPGWWIADGKGSLRTTNRRLVSNNIVEVISVVKTDKVTLTLTQWITRTSWESLMGRDPNLNSQR